MHFLLFQYTNTKFGVLDTPMATIHTASLESLASWETARPSMTMPTMEMNKLLVHAQYEPISSPISIR